MQRLHQMYRHIAPGLQRLPPRRIMDFEEDAKDKLNTMAYLYYGYVDCEGQVSQACRRTFDSIRLMPRILRDVSSIDISCDVFGARLAMPVMIAPSACHIFADLEGEVATARGAGAGGAGYCYNWMLSSRHYKEVVGESGVKWLHLYIFKQRALVEKAIELAEATGAFSAVILTCDHPHMRVQDTIIPVFNQAVKENPSIIDASALFYPNQHACGMPPLTGQDVMSGAVGEENWGVNDRMLSFDCVSWVKARTALPVVVKGVLCPQDAILAIEAGADAIVVSNHGGRQFDAAPAAIEVLPSVVAAVAGRCDVWLDTGVRKSADVLKAICLGAKGVLLGRPPLWALASGGSEGLQHMLNGLAYDLESDMMSLGVTKVADLVPGVIYAPDRKRLGLEIS